MRLAAFAGVLVVAGGGLALLGGAIDPIHDGDEASGHGHEAGADDHAGAGDHAAGHDAAMPAAGGLASAEDGFRLEVIDAPAAAGERSALRFRILAPDGAQQTAFDPEQGGVPLHLIVVRRDLTGFQHLHPRMAPDGTWSIPLRLPEAGWYRAFADFTVAGEARTLGIDLPSAGDLRSRPLPAPALVARAGATAVTARTGTPRAGQEEALEFDVAEADGSRTGLGQYLGADGHLVALREGDLAYLHVHPRRSSGQPGHIAFAATFPSAGRYRLFLQFRRADRVERAEFTVEVTR
jgi:hypothetical protein